MYAGGLQLETQYPSIFKINNDHVHTKVKYVLKSYAYSNLIFLLRKNFQAKEYILVIITIRQFFVFLTPTIGNL